MSVCFTTGEGPARVGSLCALPFTYKGTVYTTCASLREVIPLGLDTASSTEFPSTWCSTASTYNESVSDAWGFCGSCIDKSVFDSLPDASSTGKKFTLSGCTCADVWKLPGYEPCRSACCAPDNDGKAWCLAEDPACEGAGWGYCKNANALQTSGLQESTWFDEVTFLTDITQAPTDGPVPASLAPSAGTVGPTNFPVTARPTEATARPSTTSITAQPTESGGQGTSNPSGNAGPEVPTTLFPSHAPSRFTDTVRPTSIPVDGSFAPTLFDPAKRTVIPTAQPTDGDDQAPIIVLTIFLISIFAAAGVFATRRFLAVYEDRDQKKQEEAESDPSESANAAVQRQPSDDNKLNASTQGANTVEAERVDGTKQSTDPMEAKKQKTEDSAPDLTSNLSLGQRLRLKMRSVFQGSTKIKIKTDRDEVQAKSQEEIQEQIAKGVEAKESQSKAPNATSSDSTFATNQT